MNRRSFFQSVIAGIGALVGHKYLSEAKPIEAKKDEIQLGQVNNWGFDNRAIPAEPEIIILDVGATKDFGSVDYELIALPSGCSYRMTIWGIGCDGGYKITGCEFSTDAKTNTKTN